MVEVQLVSHYLAFRVKLKRTGFARNYIEMNCKIVKSIRGSFRPLNIVSPIIVL